LFGVARETKSEVSLRLSLQSGSGKASTNGFHCFSHRSLCLLNGEEEKRRGKRREKRDSISFIDILFIRIAIVEPYI
jgi:hypothetical protein